jgi:uncharacterized protein YoxC
VLWGVIKYIINVAVLGTIFYAISLHKELKSTETKLKAAQQTITALREELEEAYYHIRMYEESANK